MLRLMAILFGVAFVFAGVAGNMPNFMKDGLLFGYFEVDNIHNLAHIITGVIAIMAATRHSLTSLFFKLFGIFYTAVGIYGFYSNGDLFVTHTNLYGNILHISIGVFSLFLGFNSRKKD